MYCRADDLRLAWPKIATTAFTNEDLAVLIARSDALIDAYLAGRYDVPFAAMPDTPAIIHQISRDLTVPYLLDRLAGATPTWIVRLHDDTIERLEGLASGKIGVVGVDGTSVNELTNQGVIRSTTRDYIPTFGVAPSLNERVDPNRADDEDAERD